MIPPTKPVVLYDGFSEFEVYSAFFCDAVSALSRNQDDGLDASSAVCGLAEGKVKGTQWGTEGAAWQIATDRQ